MNAKNVCSAKLDRDFKTMFNLKIQNNFDMKLAIELATSASLFAIRIVRKMRGFLDHSDLKERESDLVIW